MIGGIIEWTVIYFGLDEIVASSHAYAQSLAMLLAMTVGGAMTEKIIAYH
jgi:hypothetical protein